MKYSCDWCHSEHESLTPEQVKAMYGHVLAGGHLEVRDIRHLEHTLKKEFSNTAEFHRLVKEYLIRQTGTTLTPGEMLKRERKRYRITQRKLGRLLGVTKMAVSQYESGSRPLSPAASGWLHSEKPPLEGK